MFCSPRHDVNRLDEVANYVYIKNKMIFYKRDHLIIERTVKNFQPFREKVDVVIDQY